MQFNPHFLYNTLATVRYLVKLDPDGAVRTVVSLAELLRYSLNKENSYVELSEDLKYIENYLTILETRFGSKFSFDIKVPDDCMDAVIPKLIVQPVIENAVKYGFEGVPSMKISVRVEKGDPQKTRGGLGGANSEPRVVDNFRGLCGLSLRREKRGGKNNCCERLYLHKVHYTGMSRAFTSMVRSCV